MKEKQGQRRKKISYFLPYLSCVLLLVSGIMLFCAAKIPGFADGEMRLDAPEETDVVRAMEALSAKYESLQGFYPRPKKLIVSEILSYQSLTGIYAPFTVEANYNGDM